ncbi:unnamed protein product [Pleuronectes platessa]|uniref:Uncharacterized protein n=1 Tax=Pleuronectes platessa TaxID=8262 RepID=A0A9N7UKS2_PLEPL|nr:unnamed protein product [Pleuronectes platessa]
MRARDTNPNPYQWDHQPGPAKNSGLMECSAGDSITSPMLLSHLPSGVGPEVCCGGRVTLAVHRHVPPPSEATIGWHLWGSVKDSFSDRTQEPRGVAGNWEKDNVGGTRRAVGGLKRWHPRGCGCGGAGT